MAKKDDRFTWNKGDLKGYNSEKEWRDSVKKRSGKTTNTKGGKGLKTK